MTSQDSFYSLFTSKDKAGEFLTFVQENKDNPDLLHKIHNKVKNLQPGIDLVKETPTGKIYHLAFKVIQKEDKNFKPFSPYGHHEYGVKLFNLVKDDKIFKQKIGRLFCNAYRKFTLIDSTNLDTNTKRKLLYDVYKSYYYKAPLLLSAVAKSNNDYDEALMLTRALLKDRFNFYFNLMGAPRLDLSEDVSNLLDAVFNTHEDIVRFNWVNRLGANYAELEFSYDGSSFNSISSLRDELLRGVLYCIENMLANYNLMSCTITRDDLVFTN